MVSKWTRWNNTKNLSLLIDALEKGDTKKAKKLIIVGFDVNEKDMYTKNTPLTLAVKKCYTEIVQLLIDYDVNLNLKNGEGETPLICATKNASDKIVELLLESGADPNLTNLFGESALTIALKNKSKEIVKILIKNGASIDLLKAAREGKSDVVKKLLKEGIDVNASEKMYGNTALMLAAKKGNVEIIHILIKHGAKIDIEDKIGNTALMWAKEEGHEEATMMLMKAEESERRSKEKKHTQNEDTEVVTQKSEKNNAESGSTKNAENKINIDINSFYLMKQIRPKQICKASFSIEEVIEIIRYAYKRHNIETVEQLIVYLQKDFDLVNFRSF